ncbi:riboflavin synthase [Pseudothioglobus sp. nBUS_23]|jgi:riboflavin synthase|uniref:riboflavin synthase n=1 Tax=Pseudothioglobus sp. nBUS_23 TaxID=3395318 RepID=UPI003EC0041B
MFTGIIQSKGSIKEIFSSSDGARLKINTNALDLSDTKVGDSIAVDGVCLTVTELTESSFTADVSNETLTCTTFSALKQGKNVNLERSLRVNQGVDGHLVSGHVDGIGAVNSIEKDGDSVRIKIEVQGDIIKYIAKKGSICINGVSLTVNSVENNFFDVNIVPHTLSATTLGDLSLQSNVNIEIDQIARYVERLLSQNEE